MNMLSNDQDHTELAIEAKGVVKTFGKNRAVDEVDLTVEKGAVYSFLGPNGAGKTTITRMLATLLKPDAGHIRILGYDLVQETDEVRNRIGLTGQFASLDEDLTGRENLIMIARLTGYSWKCAKKRADELLNAFGLQEAAKRLVKKYSGGMRRRIDIAASIVVSPELLFLDEPTTGLDPRSRHQVWDIIRVLVNTGTTVLLTTQYLDEADQLADRIAVIDEGKIIAEGTSSELKASVGSGTLQVRLLDPETRPEAEQLLADKLDTVIQLSSDPAVLSARISDNMLATHALGELGRANIAVKDFSLGQPSLDEVFLSVTGRPNSAEEVSQ
ncbi:ATP-binding cassette domain-containing protein [Salicibibacter cibarius]|uniref:ATP-binding cassette domain-containing protein n=1 Tax=Salicibibacter cibarius TaxID=2743000 RepID=A0A7T7CBL6_9BACI|nr:ATP-binding cassette domain-containing protein [Salicibibacter cibarius]QQK76052.1 ATP-binding cassette domain-containing protein [Salicibibacter cibarius]